MTWCIWLRIPGMGVEMRGMRPGNTLLKPSGMDSQFLSHLWISFTMDKCSIKTIPSPILSKTLVKKAQLIEQTGKLNRMTSSTTAEEQSSVLGKVYALLQPLEKCFIYRLKSLLTTAHQQNEIQVILQDKNLTMV